MEAAALFGFEATQADELSFRKGNKLKILNKDDTNWYKAECEGREGFIPSNYVESNEPSWYMGKISRSEAEKMLQQTTGRNSQPDGAFVVRKSESDECGHSLSVKSGSGVQHFKILHDKASGTYYLWNQKFDSINELVKHHRMVSVSKESQKPILLRDMVDTSQPQGSSCKAMFNFQAQDDQELSFDKGDILTIIEKQEKDWWKGELNGRTGLIPSNYVEEL